MNNGASGDNRQRSMSLVNLVFPVLTIVFGLQVLRTMIPAVVYTYGAQAGVSSIDMGIFVLVVFLLAFLAPLFARLLGMTVALWVSGAGVGFARLILQLVADPYARLWLSAGGVLLFLFFVPIYLGYSRNAKSAPNFGLSLLLGFMLDSALHGVFGSYDYVWQIGGILSIPFVLTAIMQIAQIFLLTWFVSEEDSARKSDRRFITLLPLIGIGALMMLNVVIWQNSAVYAATLDVPLTVSYLIIMFANLVGFVIALITLAVNSRIGWGMTLIASIALLIVSLTMQGNNVIGLFFAQASIAVLLVQFGRGDVAEGDRPGLLHTSIAWGLSAFVFVLLTFIYYVSYDLKLPFENTILPPIAAVIAALAAIGARYGTRASEDPVQINWRLTRWALVLLLLPAVTLLLNPTPDVNANAAGLPLRVMSYNLHQGFDIDGMLGMEALAQNIEQSGADVIALQEVSRGWYINASLDMLDWLSHRLNMTYVFAGAADAVWGNAVLSRYPIRDWGSEPLPRGGVPLKRNFVWAEVDIGAGESLRVVSTHLHHTNDEAGDRVRLLQFPQVIDSAWGGRANTVIMGDLNAVPDSPVIDLARNAGMLDAFDLAGGGDGFTFRSDNPARRIDYILLSSDLSASNFETLTSTASDHRGVAVTIQRNE